MAASFSNGRDFRAGRSVPSATGWDWAKKLSGYPVYKNALATNNKVRARTKASIHFISVSSDRMSAISALTLAMSSLVDSKSELILAVARGVSSHYSPAHRKAIVRAQLLACFPTLCRWGS